MGVFGLAGLMSTRTRKVFFFLILRISVSSELVDLNCLICYGICHAV